jgi:hypothetical protein
MNSFAFLSLLLISKINLKINVDKASHSLRPFCLYKKTKLHGLSPRAIYTDRATTACRRSDSQLFADRGCHVVSVTNLYGRILDFLDSSRYFYIK